MASTIKVDTIDTPSGSGSIRFSQPVAGDGNALVGISPRNFIIDGDFTQWPTGTTITAVNGYCSALLFAFELGSGAYDCKRSTVVPTVAQSGHQSAYSFHVDVTTADASLASGEVYSLKYAVTGSDYAQLHGQECTLAFWVRSPKTGQHSVSFTNSAGNRKYLATYTVSSADTWEHKTITLTMDSSGTWLFTEADVGMSFRFSLGYHSDQTTTASSSWATDATNWAVDGDVNIMDNTANNFYLSQVGLYLGGSAPTFTSPPISTVKGQVDYYVQRIGEGDSEGGEPFYQGHAYSTTNAFCGLIFRNIMRKIPTITDSGASDFLLFYQSTAAATTSVVESIVTRRGCRWTVAVASGLTASEGVTVMASDANTYIMLDARH